VPLRLERGLFGRRRLGLVTCLQYESTNTDMSRSAELLRFLEQLRITDLVDFVIVWAIVYGLLKLVRGTRAVQMAVGLLGVGLLYQISVILGLDTLQFVMRNTLLYFGFAILVIFAPEIRSALMRVGSNLGPFRFGHAKASHEAYDDIVLAAMTLSSRKVGALVVLERNVGLQNYIDTGVMLGAALSYDLLVTIFDPHTPLHDGATIIRNYRLEAASCFLPLTLNPRLSKELCTRHRAAIGVTEDTDAAAIVVSEETGVISFVQNGEITRYLNSTSLRELIRNALEPQRSFVEAVRPARRARRKTDATGDAPREQVSETYIK
jgi:diadenylate cyclase